MGISQPVVVAIPARNEEERIGPCLEALARQPDSRFIQVVVLLNNCTDDTVPLVRGLGEHLPMIIHPIVVDLPPSRAGAGRARRMAMDQAARLAPDGVLFTTDADGCVAPDWIAANLAAMRRGVEAVAGQAVIDPVEAALIPAHLHEADAWEQVYTGLLDEIACLIDPDPADPWPRHTQHSGASIAVTAAAYRKARGMPEVAVGEDRAFIHALRCVDIRIRHAPEVEVVVSGRTVGRAAGGMADTIRRRMVMPDELLDAALEPAGASLRRSQLRRACRDVWSGLRDPRDVLRRLASALAMRPDHLQECLSRCFFGAGWAEIEQTSPALMRQPVRAADVAEEILHARRILATLHHQGRQPAAHPAELAAD